MNSFFCNALRSHKLKLNMVELFAAVNSKTTTGRFISTSTLQHNLKAKVRTSSKFQKASSSLDQESDDEDFVNSNYKDETFKMDEKSAKDKVLSDEELNPSLRSHPYRRFITDWKSKEDLASYLLENIVYHADGVLAVNKPYGVGVSNVQDIKRMQKEVSERQGIEWREFSKQKDPQPSNSLYHARGVSTSSYTISDVLPILRSKLGLNSLILAKSTEKFSSGIAVFAEDTNIGDKMKSCYKSSKSHKIKTSSYLVISSLTPQLENGFVKETVGISFQDAEFKGQASKIPIIERNFSTNRMKRHEIVNVQAEVTLHSSNPYLKSSLTEIQTTVTKYHFLRIYSADLLMPILGDHLFSNRVQTMMNEPITINPLSAEPGASHQKLSKDLLIALSMRQRDDSIIIPLHAHQYKFTLPNYFGKKKHLVLTTPPPPYFQWTCKKLHLDLNKALENTQNQSDTSN